MVVLDEVPDRNLIHRSLLGSSGLAIVELLFHLRNMKRVTLLTRISGAEEILVCVSQRHPGAIPIGDYKMGTNKTPWGDKLKSELR